MILYEFVRVSDGCFTGVNGIFLNNSMKYFDWWHLQVSTNLSTNDVIMNDKRYYIDLCDFYIAILHLWIEILLKTQSDLSNDASEWLRKAVHLWFLIDNNMQ